MLAAVCCHSHLQPCVSSSRGLTRLIKPTIVTSTRDEPRQPSCLFRFFSFFLFVVFTQNVFCLTEEEEEKKQSYKNSSPSKCPKVSLVGIEASSLSWQGGKENVKYSLNVRWWQMKCLGAAALPHRPPPSLPPPIPPSPVPPLNPSASCRSVRLPVSVPIRFHLIHVTSINTQSSPDKSRPLSPSPHSTTTQPAPPAYRCLLPCVAWHHSLLHLSTSSLQLFVFSSGRK